MPKAMKLIQFLFILTVLTFFSAQTFSQQKKPIPLAKIYTDSTDGKKKDTSKLVINGVQQKDLFDIIAQIRHKKINVTDDSVTSKPQFSIVPAIGYTLVTKFAVVVSGNVAFRLDSTARVSTIVASTSYTQNSQFTLPVQTSIWTKNNKFNFVGDYRYFKYPQSTFGLGTNSNINDEVPMDYSFVRFYETAMKRITGNFYAGAGYIVDDHWNISYDVPEQNTNPHPGFAFYGRARKSVASGFTLNALYDSRDNGINPSSGTYANVVFRTSIKDLGSTNQWQSLIIDIRKYIRFPEGSQNVLALWSYDWLILNGRPSYLDLPSTGWDQNSATGRGYIQGRFRGAQMVYAETEYRFKITSNGLIGGVVFLNGESFSAASGTKLESIQPGYGPGLRIKLSKVSKTNLDVDYGFGNQGSKGLFLTVGEVF
jgi:hypothetical protein